MIAFKKKVKGSLVVGVNEYICSGEISITDVGLLTKKFQLEFKGVVLADESLMQAFAFAKGRHFVKCAIKTPDFKFTSDFTISSISLGEGLVLNLTKVLISIHSAISKSEAKILMASQPSKRQMEQLSHFARQGVKVRLK